MLNYSAAVFWKITSIRYETICNKTILFLFYKVTHDEEGYKKAICIGFGYADGLIKN